MKAKAKAFSFTSVLCLLALILFTSQAALAGGEAKAIPIVYDTLVTDSIAPLGDIDAFTFVGSAGDTIILRVDPDGSYFDATLELFFGSSLIFEDHGSNGSQVNLVDSVLPYSGTYTVYVRDSQGDDICGYWLSLQCRQDVRAKAIPIAYDTLVTDSIAPLGDIDAFTFVGSAGDTIILRVDPDGSYFDATLELFFGSSLIFEDHGSNGSQVNLVDSVLPYSGTYTVYVRDSQGDDICGYWLSLQCRQDVRAKAIPIVYDTLVTDSIAPLGDIDAFTFVGSAGDTIILRVDPDGSYFDATLELFFGSSLIFEDHGSNGSQVNLVDSVLPYSGTYTVYVRDSQGDDICGYWLSLQCRQDVRAKAIPIAYDTLVTDSIAPLGDIDAFTFVGSAGDTIILRVDPDGSYFDATLELFFGSSLIFEDHGSNGSQVNLVDSVLPYSGTYTVYVRDSQGDDICGYWLSLQCRERCQKIALGAGWQWTSTGIDPDPCEIPSIFFSCWTGYLNIVKACDGSFCIPGVGCWIDCWNVLEMYSIHMADACTISICGSKVPTDTPIPLPVGWNSIAYLPECPLPPESALVSIWDCLDIVQNDDGWFCIPGVGCWIDCMEYNEGYKVHLHCPDTLIYPTSCPPCPPPFAKANSHGAFVKATHFSYSGNTGESYSVVVNSIDLNDQLSEVGDEVGVFTSSGLCVGAGVWEGDIVGIVACKDDDQTKLVDGFLAGEEIVFKLWDRSENKEVELSTSFERGDGRFGTDAYALVNLKGVAEGVSSQLPKEFQLAQNYPNPFNPETKISYALPNDCHVKLTIYNLLGQEIKVLVEEYQTAGHGHVYWDGKDDKGKEVASGIYFYQIEAIDLVDTKKMVLLK